jgi:hypothetical protein
MYSKVINGVNCRSLIISCKHEIWQIIKLFKYHDFAAKVYKFAVNQ